MSQNLRLPLCPACKDTVFVKEYTGHSKLAAVYCCVRCWIYWSSDLGIQELPEMCLKYIRDIQKD